MFFKARIIIIFVVFSIMIVVVASNGPTFWLRWFSQPDGDQVITSWDWYNPVEPIALGPTQPLPVALPENKTITASGLQEALSYAKNLNSIALLIAHNGVLQQEYYKQGFDRNSILDSQSMHKGILGVALAIALDKGFIPSLDMPVHKYFPDWIDDGRQAITVGHLIHMTSGLEQVEFKPHPFSPGQKLFLGSDLLGLVSNVPIYFEPGTAFDFNHINSQVLHTVLTSATGMRYSEFLRKYLWEPMGGGFAQVRLDRKNGDARVFCCIQTRPMDWVKLGTMIANGGFINNNQLISEEWLTRLMTGGKYNKNFGFHVWLGSPYEGSRLVSGPSNRRVKVSEPFFRDDVVYIEGRGGQRLYVVPSEKLVAYRAGKIDFSWDDARFINILLRNINTVSNSLEERL